MGVVASQAKAVAEAAGCVTEEGNVHIPQVIALAGGGLAVSARVIQMVDHYATSEMFEADMASNMTCMPPS